MATNLQDDLEALLQQVLGPATPPPAAPTPAPAPVAASEPVLPLMDLGGPVPIPNAPLRVAPPQSSLIPTTPNGPPVPNTSGKPPVPAAAPAPLQTPEPDQPEPEPDTTPVRKSGVKAPLPVFTVGELAEAFDIRNFASLATLTTSRWHAKVKDRTVAKEAEDQQAATRGAFDAYKHLLVGADEKLKRVTAALDAARTKHYAMTLPWTTTGLDDGSRRKGARLLPNTLFFDYVSAMAGFKQEMESALDEFIPDYPALVQQAQQRLGKRFDAKEFPTPQEIRDRFDLSFDFQPIPKGDDFRGLPDQQLEALARAVNDKTTTMIENAMQDVWARLHAAMVHMEDRLSSPDKAFHDTMVGNVQELSHLLGHLNVTNDQRLVDLKAYLDKRITNVAPDDLRKKPTVRAEVCASVRNVLAEMEKKGGQP